MRYTIGRAGPKTEARMRGPERRSVQRSVLLQPRIGGVVASDNGRPAGPKFDIEVDKEIWPITLLLTVTVTKRFFWGKVTEKDIRKRALLGNCFDSPVVRSSTPRPSATKKLAGSSSQVLPDVLNDSVKHSFPANCEELPNIEEPKGSSNVENSAILNDSLNKDEDVDSDVVIIDLDGQNDSVVIISDDENLTGNDELCQNRSGNKPTVGTGEDKFCDTFSAISTEDKIEHTSRIEVENSSQTADKTTDDVLKNLNEYLGNNSTVSDLSFNSKTKIRVWKS
ncbi:uncharacterized protein LOC124363668 [Homalodisca vitripennis]|uniref:uncharacterized protein LOC124363668 n=1 Tax=Homalodisca vitripennis TaxID=197043 RepID=UPI001EEBEF5B|nr:uncharacterized protein LOC124363668 [Homalodisca vitripennis]